MKLASPSLKKKQQSKQSLKRETIINKSIFKKLAEAQRKTKQFEKSLNMLGQIEGADPGIQKTIGDTQKRLTALQVKFNEYFTKNNLNNKPIETK